MAEEDDMKGAKGLIDPSDEQSTPEHSPKDSEERNKKKSPFQLPPPVYRKESTQSRLGNFLSDPGYQTARVSQMSDLMESRTGTPIKDAEEHDLPGNLFDDEEGARREASI